MQEPTSPRRAPASAKKSTASWVVLLVLLLVALAGAAYLMRWRFLPVRKLGDLELGMREVDTSLAFGRAPDETNISAFGKRKELVFYGVLKRTNLLFVSENNSFKLAQICSSMDTPISQGIYPGTTENDVIGMLGEPSYVSVSSDGTTKISTFGRSHMAFEFKQGNILMSCVSDLLPVRYPQEYGQPVFKLPQAGA